jgi:hypothetical protein
MINTEARPDNRETGNYARPSCVQKGSSTELEGREEGVTQKAIAPKLLHQSYYTQSYYTRESIDNFALEREMDADLKSLSFAQLY